MAATRHVAEMVERNQDLRWVTDRQVKRMRDDTRTARRLAYYEYTRLDEIMRLGMTEGGVNIDVERYRNAYEAYHTDERDPEAPNDEPAPPNNQTRRRLFLVCMTGVTLAVVIAKAYS
jgi:hypothetical protein